MNFIELKFYLSMFEKQGHKPLYESILEQAHKLGVKKGSAFKAVAGFGRKGELLEEHFFDTGADAPFEIHLLLSEEQEKKLFAYLEEKKVHVYFSRKLVEIGQT